jgi:hypothetical protein
MLYFVKVRDTFFFSFLKLLFTYSSPINFKPFFCECQIHLALFDYAVLYFLDGDVFTYTRREPIGVCGQIIPVSCFSWREGNPNSIQFGLNTVSNRNGCLCWVWGIRRQSEPVLPSPMRAL